MANFTEEQAKELIARAQPKTAAHGRKLLISERRLRSPRPIFRAPAVGGIIPPEREPGRGHKYGARATVVDGIRFPSIAEAEYYKRSKLRQAAGEIDYFLLWPCFVLPGGVRGCALISRSSPADRWSISM